MKRERERKWLDKLGMFEEIETIITIKGDDRGHIMMYCFVEQRRFQRYIGGTFI